MEFKGTKGKWVVVNKDTDFETYICTDTHRVCECKHYEGQITELLEPTLLEGKANALLISKALMLLEDAQMHVDAVDLSQIDFYNKYDFNVSELITKTRILIKEATEI